MNNKIVLAGGSGYLGSVLARHFRDKASDIVILSRKGAKPAGPVRTLVWDGRTAGDWVAELEGCGLLVNLAGKNVNCRYTKSARLEIRASRVESTRILGTVLMQLKHPQPSG